MKIFKQISRKLAILAGCIVISMPYIFAQQDLKSWTTAQLNLSFTQKLDLKISHMRAFDLGNGFNPDFNQSTVQLNYDLTKKIGLAAGYTFTGSNSLTDGGSRITVKAGYKMKLAKILSWSNSAQGEVHSGNETRYHYRLILNSRLSPRKRFNFLKLSPSASYSLFYNIGGAPIQYYDRKSNIPVVKQTPDGFHRGRLLLNLNSKITKNLSLSAYYMMQREFNLFVSDYRRMNIVKPVTGRIVRAFDNYNVIGLSLIYDINLAAKN